MDMPSRIAVLGFGSLPNQVQSPVYNTTLHVKKPMIEPGSIPGCKLDPTSPFVAAKGLRLPTRLARVSSADTENRRITMSLCPGASDEPVFVAQSQFQNLNEAIRDLRIREGISEQNFKNIGYVNLSNNTSRSKMPEVANKVKQWAQENGFTAVVWTDLSPNIDFGPSSTGREIEPMLARDPTLLVNTQKYIEHLAGPVNGLQKRILTMRTNAPAPASQDAYQASLTADFNERAKAENQTHKPKSQWYTSESNWDWGPSAAAYPEPAVPAGVDPIEWKRDRVIEAAKYWVNKGVPYSSATAYKFNLPLPENVEPRFGLRGHFPARNCGLDCSNFSAWIYNFALGKQFSGAVNDQINDVSHTVGRKVGEHEQLKKGDLIYYRGVSVNHVAIYMDSNHVIESTSSGEGKARIVDITKPEYAYLRPNGSNPKFLFARRAVE